MTEVENNGAASNGNKDAAKGELTDDVKKDIARQVD